MMEIAVMEEFVSTVEAMLKTLECPICLELLKEPVSAGCGHFFCRQCFSGILQSAYRAPCPLCKRSFTRRSAQDAFQRQSIISASKIFATTCASLTGINFIAQDPIIKLTADTNATVPLKKKLKLSNGKIENASSRKRKSSETKDGGEENIKDKNVSDFGMENNSNVGETSSVNKRACLGSEDDESDLPTLAELFQAFQKNPASVVDKVIAGQQGPSIKLLPDKTIALKTYSMCEKAQNANVCDSFDSLIGDSLSKARRISSSEYYEGDGMSNKRINHNEIKSYNVPLKDKMKIKALKNRTNKVYSDQYINQDEDSSSKPKILKEKKKIEIELEDKSKENDLCLSPIVESSAVSLKPKPFCTKKLNKRKKKNSSTKQQNSNTSRTSNFKKSATSSVHDKKYVHVSNKDTTNLSEPCAEKIIEDPFKSMGLTDTAVSVDYVASPLATKVLSVQKSPGWSRVKEVKKDFKVKKFTLLHVEKNSPSVSVKSSTVSDHETSSTANTAKSYSTFDPRTEERVETKLLGVSDVAGSFTIHQGENYNMENTESTDSSSLMTKEMSEAIVHCKDVPKPSNLSNVEESNLYEVPKEMDCSAINTGKWNPVDAPCMTLLRTNSGPAESRIVISNIPSGSITPNSLMCEKYSDALNTISSRNGVKSSKVVSQSQNPFSMRKNSVDSSCESIGPDNVQKCPLICEQELSANAPDFPLTTNIPAEYEIHQTHSVHNDDFHCVEQSQQTSQVFDFHKTVCDDNLRPLVVHPPFYCSNTEKTKVVKRHCLTLEEIQECFLKSSRCNSSETICTLPFLSGLFKLHIGVSDETLNVSILRVIDSSLEENITESTILLSNKCIQASDNLIVSSLVVPSSNTESEVSQPDTNDPFPYLNKKHLKPSSADSLNGTELDPPIQNYPHNQATTGFQVLESNDRENFVKNCSLENQDILVNEKDAQNLSEMIHFPQEPSEKIQKESSQIQKAATHSFGGIIPQEESSLNSSTLKNPEQFQPKINAESMELDFSLNKTNCSSVATCKPSTAVDLKDTSNSEEEESFRKLQQCVHKERVIHKRKQNRLSLKQKKHSWSRIQTPESDSDGSDSETSVKDKWISNKVKKQTSLSKSPKLPLSPTGDFYSATAKNSKENLMSAAEMPSSTLNSILLSEDTSSQVNASAIIAEIDDLSAKIRCLEEKLQECGTGVSGESVSEEGEEWNRSVLGAKEEELNKSVTVLEESEEEDSVDIFPPTP